MRCSEMLFLVLMCLFISSCTQKESAKDLGGMVKIEGGTYVAGLDPSIAFSECKKYAGSECRLDWFENARPHQETVGTFNIDMYLVTQAEYERVMGNNPSHFTSWFSRCPNCPVESVTWNEADAYCQKVGKRLPTEWEWEKAAKGGSETIYAWGSNGDMAGDYAWYVDNSGKKTHPVGEKKPNGYGLYDMAGNVLEWTSSYYDFDSKTVRGGSLYRYVLKMRPSDREYSKPVDLSSSVGFRCAQSEKNQQSAKVEQASQPPVPSDGAQSKATAPSGDTTGYNWIDPRCAKWCDDFDHAHIGMCDTFGESGLGCTARHSIDIKQTCYKNMASMPVTGIVTCSSQISSPPYNNRPLYLSSMIHREVSPQEAERWLSQPPW